MKKHITKMVLLLAFAAVTISGCSLQYRQSRMHKHDRDHDNNEHRPEMHRYQSF